MSIFVKDNDNGNVNYNLALADANCVEENTTPQRTKPTRRATPDYNID